VASRNCGGQSEAAENKVTEEDVAFMVLVDVALGSKYKGARINVMVDGTAGGAGKSISSDGALEGGRGVMVMVGGVGGWARKSRVMAPWRTWRRGLELPTPI
jgi:hypothetical protein